MPRKTGRAASIARRKKSKEQKKKKAPSGIVAGASTSTQIGSARGDDFAESFSTPEGENIAGQGSDDSPRSREELEGSTFRLGGGGGISQSAQRAAEAASRKERREARDRRRRLSAGGRLASDNLRASNLDTVETDRITTKGARSSGSGDRDETQRTGAGTEENPLTNIQIQDLEDQGFREGDFIEGKGILTPLGTFEPRNEGQELADEATDLAAKDITPSDNIVVSDDEVVKDEKDAVDTIDEAAKVVRDLTFLDEEIANLQAGLEAEVKGLQEQFKLDREALKGEQASETGQTAVGLANAGGFLGFSGSATGVLLNLAKGHRTELQSLEAAKEQAIFEARDAARNSQFDLVKLKAQEIKDIEQETYNRQQDYLNRTKSINEKEAAKKAKSATESDIFSAIQGGATTVADIFSKLGGEVDADTISKFLEDVTPESAEGFKFSASQNAALLGAGMSLDDVRAVSEYVSENGYDDTIKGVLTPGQKAAVDKIFKTGAVGTGNAANFTPTQKNRLEQAGLLEAPRQEQLDFLFGGEEEAVDEFESIYTSQILDNQTTLDALPFEVQEEAREELLDIGFGSDVVPQWYKDFIEVEQSQTLSGDSLKSSWSSYRKKALGEIEDTPGTPWWKFGK